MTLKTELEQLLNKHSVENNSSTPDCILAEYMLSCLAAFETAVMQRDKWYGRDNVVPLFQNVKRTIDG